MTGSKANRGSFTRVPVDPFGSLAVEVASDSQPSGDLLQSLWRPSSAAVKDASLVGLL
jgi:hypothetical protein